MQLDHLSYAAGPEGADATADGSGACWGRSSSTAVSIRGSAPGIRSSRCPAAATSRWSRSSTIRRPRRRPFGQAVRARSADGGGWLGWVVAVDDLGRCEARIGRPAIEGHRHLPDGKLLEWEQLGVKGLQSDPQLPFFVRWLSDPVRPSVGRWGRGRAARIEIAGIRAGRRLARRASAGTVLPDVDIDWIAPDGQPGLIAATFGTPHGVVRI